MEQIIELLQKTMGPSLVSAVISGPRMKDNIQKIKVRPILIKDELMIQCESFTKTKAFHHNMKPGEAVQNIVQWMQDFKQMQLQTVEYSYNVLISKKGKVTIQKKKQNVGVQRPVLSHNKKKKYILEEGVHVPFLEDLGVYTKEGKIVQSRYDKFRQINRFLEFVEDILPQLPKDREATILDFGCGKSYLTFAMYYYLHELKGLDVRMIGLDLKTEVIQNCNELSKKYGYQNLKFLEGNIADYTGVDAVDMVVTLHACDTATDFALDKAIGWNAKVILSVPCCQHELNGQIESEVLSPILGYGLIKERIASLVTDGLRAEYLKSQGYDTQILEFIDMEHTPKNILIRGVKTGKKADNIQAIEDCKQALHVDPILGRLIKEHKE